MNIRHGARATRTHYTAAALLAVATCCLTVPALADPGNQPWASSSGNTGAGLGVVSPQDGRFHAEAALHAQDGLTAFSPLFGAGFFVSPDVELEFMIPLSFASVDFNGETESSLRLGQPYFGVNYVSSSARLRYKIGGGLAWNPTDTDAAGGVALLAGGAMRGTWDPWLWTTEQFSLAAPFRLEYDLSDSVVFGVDAGFAFMVPTNDNDDDELDMVFEAAPGIGFHLSDEWLFGMRLAGVLVPTSEGENDQFSFEPYIRGAFDSGFFLARFTINLDEPYGHSFQENEIWGLTVGGGVAW